ncbi:hypothetical protein OBBRIDRAFT_568965 [Obba rivulosa]|uniref:Uncharacterized protein n=1 Tax=Obba rivulosa TaxID=1052685 RepID=A0A8E2DED0_9APHY|nr:hypothetical protein OBBRIDRAFT_568965 [Obba rivulosa]
MLLGRATLKSHSMNNVMTEIPHRLTPSRGAIQLRVIRTRNVCSFPFTPLDSIADAMRHLKIIPCIRLNGPPGSTDHPTCGFSLLIPSAFLCNVNMHPLLPVLLSISPRLISSVMLCHTRTTTVISLIMYVRTRDQAVSGWRRLLNPLKISRSLLNP